MCCLLFDIHPFIFELFRGRDICLQTLLCAYHFHCCWMFTWFSSRSGHNLSPCFKLRKVLSVRDVLFLMAEHHIFVCSDNIKHCMFRIVTSVCDIADEGKSALNYPILD